MVYKLRGGLNPETKIISSTSEQILLIKARQARMSLNDNWDNDVRLRTSVWRRTLKSIGVNRKFELRATHITCKRRGKLVSFNMVYTFKNKEEAMLFKLSYCDDIAFYGEDFLEDGTIDNPVMI